MFIRPGQGGGYKVQEQDRYVSSKGDGNSFQLVGPTPLPDNDNNDDIFRL